MPSSSYADALAAAARGVDAIVHLVARTGVVDSIEDPRGDAEVNVLGTLNALLAACDGGAGAFVFASSGAPLGSAAPPGHEGLAPRPLSPYGASKLAGEGLCSAFGGSYGLSATALRFTNVYGPYSYHKGSVVALCLKRIMDGDPLVVYGDGEQTRDFLYVNDLCDAAIATIARRPTAGLYQLGTGTETLSEPRQAGVARDVGIEPYREVQDAENEKQRERSEGKDCFS